MNRNERAPDLEDVIRLAFRGLQSRLWTALPGIVERFDAEKMTVDVQPTINGRERSEKGEWSSLQMPVLLNCPVMWQGGGGVTLTFPIAKGDECLVIFSARAMDAWWERGGVKDPTHIRMHNLSDGFALVGLRSLPRTFAVDADEAVLRSDDGSTFVKLHPTAHTVQITAPGGINLNNVTIDANGNMNSPATITGQVDVIAGTKSGKTHTHNENGSVTGQPN